LANFGGPIIALTAVGYTYPNDLGILNAGAPGLISDTDPGVANVRSPTSYTFGGSVLTGTCHVPTASQVLSGVAVDATTGNVVLPLAVQVVAGVAFGPASGSTGTYVASYTAAANVRLGTNRGDGVTGTLHVPGASQVLATIAVDATTGTVVLPATADVRLATTFGPASGSTGSLHVPTASQVLATISVDATTGNVVLPAAGQVESGFTFGPASGTTGTFVGAGIDPGLFIGATVSAVVSAGDLTLAFTGSAPAASILQSGAIYCNLTSGAAAPGKLPIATATAVDSTHVRLTFAPAFAVAPAVNDTALIG
jgi:hypothetical protein